MIRTLTGSLLLAPALAAPEPAASAGSASDSGPVLVRAGTIHLVAPDRVLRDGGLLIEDGRIAAHVERFDAGTGAGSVPVPEAARVVDYGPDAVIVPGLVSADSRYGAVTASERTADPGVLAVDHIDAYSDHSRALVAGVTSFYVAPARGRLIAGQGAVAKAAGDERVLNASAVVHGSISADARATPGYWEPPIPATVDRGMGMARPQLPGSTMGAVVALKEILALARGGTDEQEYGRHLARELAPLLEAKRPWRMGAQSQGEIRALVDLFASEGLPLVIDGGLEAASVADELAAAGFPVIVEVSIPENVSGRDFGKDVDRPWPLYDTASRLAAAGVRVAIAVGGNADLDDLRLAAVLARRGGLDAATALRAITLEPARVLGVDDRVGSLAVGKDADLCVLSGDPLALTTHATATWVGGEVAWKARESGATVIEVDQLFVGDGEVLAPGQLLMEDGKIREVGRSVAHPRGATVVRGRAAMPGMIDALGFLGLEGSDKGLSPRFRLARLAEPGDATDRRVARAGVTTVNLASRGDPGDGSPTMAYKPAARSVENMVVGDPNALRMQWSDDNRHESGEKVRKALEKAAKYKADWEAYEKELAAWKPEPPKADDAAAQDEGSAGGGEQAGGDAADQESKDGKKKKDKDAPEPPLTGVWEGALVQTSEGDAVTLRLRLLESEGGALEGALRCSLLTDGLADLEGRREGNTASLSARGSRGPIELELEAAEGKLSGTVEHGGQAMEIGLERKGSEYEIARRPVRKKVEPEKDPKGKPRSPGLDADLEPLRRAMNGAAAVLVHVDRDDEILDCVAAFEAHGIRPVLVGAAKAWKVADRIAGRVAGVVPTHRALESGGKLGVQERQMHALLSRAGIPIAFHSGAEEGAADLPLFAAHAVAHGLSPGSALRGLTADAARLLAIEQRVGRLAAGLDADVLLLDGSALEASSRVLRVWVAGEEIR